MRVARIVLWMVVGSTSWVTAQVAPASPPSDTDIIFPIFPRPNPIFPIFPRPTPTDNGDEGKGGKGGKGGSKGGKGGMGKGGKGDEGKGGKGGKGKGGKGGKGDSDSRLAVTPATDSHAQWPPTAAVTAAVACLVVQALA